MRSRLLLIPALVLALAAACSQTPTADPSVESPAPVVTSTRVLTSAPETVVATITQTVESLPSSAAPTAAAPEPAPVAGVCPYLSTDLVAHLTGQRQSSPQLIAITPHPVCNFYKTNGEWAATVRITEAASPEAAVAIVNAAVPIDASMPADRPAGWVGGVMSEGEQYEGAEGLSTYAVSKGNVAVVVTENESRSIKARNLAECAIFGTGLETGTAPDHCTVG